MKALAVLLGVAAWLGGPIVVPGLAGRAWGELAAPTNFGHLTQTTDSITWTWTDNSSDEDGFRVYAMYTLKGTVGPDVTAWVETGLTPNTCYSRLVRAYSLTLGESRMSNTAGACTLPVPPGVSSDLAPAGPYPVGITITFTNTAGFGEGRLDYYLVAWDQAPSHAWSGSEEVWKWGTIQRTATAAGDWYLHLMSRNKNDESGGTLDYGPFVVPEAEVPSEFGASAKTTDSITWTWVDNCANEDGFRLCEGATVKATVGPGQTSIVEGGLQANTRYTRYVRAYSDALGELGVSRLVSAYTLPVPPEMTYQAGGAMLVVYWVIRRVHHYRYAWDTSPTHVWTDAEPIWWGYDTMYLTGRDLETWYFHIKSYNAAGESGGTADYGPFSFARQFDCAGWNLIALPYQPINPDPWEVFDELRPPNKPRDLLSGHLYRYDPERKGYVAYERSAPAAFGDLNRHDGYWLFLHEPLALSYEYLDPPPSPTPDSRVLAPGWNLIGSGSPASVLLDEIRFTRDGSDPLTFLRAEANGWVSVPTYGFDCASAGYTEIGLPEGVWSRWQGAWLYAREPDVTMTVHAATGISCRANLKRLASAAMNYIADWDGLFPSADSWVSDLLPYLGDDREVLRCPERPDLEVGYAMNQALSGIPEALIRDPWNTPVFFECDLGGPNPAGGVGDVALPRHGDGNFFAFTMGSVSFVIPPRDFPDFGLWDPTP